MSTFPFAPKWMNREQACWYLGDISPRKLDRLQAEGRVIPKALDGTRVYDRDDLEQLPLPDWGERKAESA